MKMLNQWQIYALGSAFFAGLVVILAKIGVRNIPSNTATLIRTVVIILFLIALVSLRKEWINPLLLDRKSYLFLILSGIATGLSWICYFRALQLGPASGVAAVDKMSLIFAVLFAGLFLGEHLKGQQWIGIVLMMAGVFFVILK